VLEEKHPDQAGPSPEVFILCENLPAFVQVDITEAHIKKRPILCPVVLV